jgi:hypothetical protein
MRVPFLFSGLILTACICNSKYRDSISPRIWLQFTKMTAAAYQLTNSKLHTPSSQASSTKIPTISFTSSLLIQWKTSMMLAALPVQWHCFETGKVSWFTSSPTQCLLFLEMFTKLPWSTPTFRAHKRHRANQKNLTPDILQKRISTVQIAQIFL